MKNREEFKQLVLEKARRKREKEKRLRRKVRMGAAIAACLVTAVLFAFYVDYNSVSIGNNGSLSAGPAGEKESYVTVEYFTQDGTEWYTYLDEEKAGLIKQYLSLFEELSDVSGKPDDTGDKYLITVCDEDGGVCCYEILPEGYIRRRNEDGWRVMQREDIKDFQRLIDSILAD